MAGLKVLNFQVNSKTANIIGCTMAGIIPKHSGKFALAFKNAVELQIEGHVLAYMP